MTTVFFLLRHNFRDWLDSKERHSANNWVFGLLQLVKLSSEPQLPTFSMPQDFDSYDSHRYSSGHLVLQNFEAIEQNNDLLAH